MNKSGVSLWKVKSPNHAGNFTEPRSERLRIAAPSTFPCLQLCSSHSMKPVPGVCQSVGLTGVVCSIKLLLRACPLPVFLVQCSTKPLPSAWRHPPLAGLRDAPAECNPTAPLAGPVSSAKPLHNAARLHNFRCGVGPVKPLRSACRPCHFAGTGFSAQLLRNASRPSRFAGAQFSVKPLCSAS